MTPDRSAGSRDKVDPYLPVLFLPPWLMTLLVLPLLVLPLPRPSHLPT